MQNQSSAQGLLQGIATAKGLKILTTFDPRRGSAIGGDCTYLVEVVSEGFDVYAQGFGASSEEATTACCADWESLAGSRRR
jgi:hypothetical protein